MIRHAKGQIYLASASPRRAELLDQIGVVYEIFVPKVEEAQLPNEPAIHYVERIARHKSLRAARLLEMQGKPRLPVLGADTCVVVDDTILGKPRDQAHALAMLKRLSGRSHRVFSAVSVYYVDECFYLSNESNVTFRLLSNNDIRAYWTTGEPADKAGAYAIQGLGAVFVERLEGSYSGVMGLPIFETTKLLKRVGVRVL